MSFCRKQVDAPLLTQEQVLPLLESHNDRWEADREAWITLEHRGIAWRVHYRRGKILEVGWWGTLEQTPAQVGGQVSRRAWRATRSQWAGGRSRPIA